MGKHIQETDLKTFNGQSLVGTGDLNIEGGGIKPKDIGFGLSYTEDKIQLGDSVTSLNGDTTSITPLSGKTSYIIGDIMASSQKGAVFGIGDTSTGRFAMLGTNEGGNDFNGFQINKDNFRLSRGENSVISIRDKEMVLSAGVSQISIKDNKATYNLLGFSGEIATVPYVEDYVSKNSGISAESIGFGLSYSDGKVQLGEESKDALGNIKHLVKLEDKDTVSIGEIVNENKRGTGGISVTKYYGTNVLIESNSSQEDNNSTLEMNGASFRLNAYRKNFNGEIRTGGVYFQNGLFYISNSDGVGNQNQIAPLEDFSAYTVGLKVDDKDYKGAIATVPYVKRTVDGMAGKGLNSANGVLNVNTKQETTDGLNLLDIYNRDGGFSLKSEHKFIAPIDGKERRAVSEIYSEEDEIRIGRTFYKDGAPDSRAIITFKDSIMNISSTRDATMNGYTILNEQNAKELSQFGKSFIKLRLSNNYIAIDSTEEPKVTLLGDVLYLNANLTNPNGVTKGIPIQAFNIFNFRPARTLYFTVPIDDGTAVIKITKLGTLTIESVSNPNSKNIYINVSFLNKEIK